jgi:hypothetical protein
VDGTAYENGQGICRDCQKVVNTVYIILGILWAACPKSFATDIGNGPTTATKELALKSPSCAHMIPNEIVMVAMG